MVKPDGVQRGLVGKILTCFEEKGLRVAALKMLRLTRAEAERHYAEHLGKPFFEDLITYITSGPVVALVLEGREAVKIVRQMLGATDPVQAAPGTIRGNYALDVSRNVAHGSDGKDSAKREISLFFLPEEIFDYQRVTEAWLYEKAE